MAPERRLHLECFVFLEASQLDVFGLLAKRHQVPCMLSRQGMSPRGLLFEFGCPVGCLTRPVPSVSVAAVPIRTTSGGFLADRGKAGSGLGGDPPLS